MHQLGSVSFTNLFPHYLPSQSPSSCHAHLLSTVAFKMKLFGNHTFKFLYFYLKGMEFINFRKWPSLFSHLPSYKSNWKSYPFSLVHTWWILHNFIWKLIYWPYVWKAYHKYKLNCRFLLSSEWETSLV